MPILEENRELRELGQKLEIYNYNELVNFLIKFYNENSGKKKCECSNVKKTNKRTTKSK